MFDDRLRGDLSALDDFAHELSHLGSHDTDQTTIPQAGASSGPGTVLPNRINAGPENVEVGLAKLVLTLIELLRRLLEKQAIRRIDAGSLSEDEIERLGETFLKLEQRMEELKATFGLQDEELNLHLGPLGDLM